MFVFATLLANHPDRPFVKSIVNILRFGADIGHCGSRTSSFNTNASSAIIHADILSTTIAKEVELEHTVGPFDAPPFPSFVCSSLGVREKKSGGHRIILDLSRPVYFSVNDAIDIQSYTLSSFRVDAAINMLISLGVGALMAKQDIKHAFRLVPVVFTWFCC